MLYLVLNYIWTIFLELTNPQRSTMSVDPSNCPSNPRNVNTWTKKARWLTSIMCIVPNIVHFVLWRTVEELFDEALAFALFVPIGGMEGPYSMYMTHCRYFSFLCCLTCHMKMTIVELFFWLEELTCMTRISKILCQYPLFTGVCSFAVHHLILYRGSKCGKFC